MPSSPLSRPPAADSLSITSDNVHCYYSTVQSDVPPQDLVDTALARRQARALELHRRRRVFPVRSAWMGLLVLAGAGIAGWVWLLR